MKKNLKFACNKEINKSKKVNESLTEWRVMWGISCEHYLAFE